MVPAWRVSNYNRLGRGGCGIRYAYIRSKRIFTIATNLSVGATMSLLNVFDEDGDGSGGSWKDLTKNSRDTPTQIVLSILLGLSAFLSFCVLRPKWTELYNARKKQSRAASKLPDLPKTMFGWIPVVYRISNGEVLSSAGLDAYAFLSFFRYASRFLTVTLFFSVTIILPVNYTYTNQCPKGFPLCPGSSNSTNSVNSIYRLHYQLPNLYTKDDDKKKPTIETDLKYLWMYVAFVYFFTAVAIYLMVVETKHLIRIRQAYLGTQHTVTDRTIRLSGIPVGLRSEDKIRDFVEDLSIGKVDSIMLCRNWKRLDELTEERMNCLRKLEEAWAKYLGHHHSLRHRRQNHERAHEISDGVESTALLSHADLEEEHASMMDRPRPTHTIKDNILPFRGTKVDAIDHFQEQLRMLDARITQLRKEEFEPTAIAFVTMESTAACQMAVQAILDPIPGQFIASLAPPPADVVWSNTYLSRNTRMMRSWGIMIIIGFMSIFWSAILAPVAGFLSIDALNTVLPGLKDLLKDHEVASSLVRTSLPTFFYSLLAIGVPYLYDYLARRQGMLSQSDVELSLISKNFFFTFFNLFVVFTILGTATKFSDFWSDLQKIVKDTTAIGLAIATSLEELNPFYLNLIILQGLGLLPFRLLEFGSVFLYPFYLISATTPRDYAELVRAPIFNYGYYLPQTMLIFVICVVYSILPSSWLITVFGLIYFVIGGFIYKYQLLYAMDHRQHSTGRAWPMICNRIIVGLLIFHVAMAGYLLFLKALSKSAATVPVIAFTIWFTVYFQRTYFPLMRFIALRSVEGQDIPHVMPPPPLSAWERDTDHGRAVDTDPDTGLRYMNPNLVMPLEALWIRKVGHDRGQQTA